MTITKTSFALLPIILFFVLYKETIQGIKAKNNTITSAHITYT